MITTTENQAAPKETPPLNGAVSKHWMENNTKLTESGKRARVDGQTET